MLPCVNGLKLLNDCNNLFPRGDHTSGGCAIWLTGLPASGKTTNSRALAEGLLAQGYSVETLDGDEIRPGLNPDLGFLAEDRQHSGGWLPGKRKRVRSVKPVPETAWLAPGKLVMSVHWCWSRM